jgi:uncharacterized protein (TIGR02646 family)
MKHIVKQDEPLAFTDWKALSNDDWKPTYSDLSGETKKAVKDTLMAEQGHICCYCERRLMDNDSHIEHFRPQSDPGVDPLDFSNLLCSCQSNLHRGEPRHCGNRKAEWFDPNLLISPFDPNCEGQFEFTGDGLISPSDQDNRRAVETIHRLGLDIPKLIALRSFAIEPFLDEGLSYEDMQQFVRGYLRQDNNGFFGEFWTTINYLFGGYVVA